MRPGPVGVRRRRYIEPIDLRITVKDGKARFTCKLTIHAKDVAVSGLLIAHGDFRTQK